MANEKYDYDGCIGETYNQLTVIKEVERERVRRFLCRCTCGVEKVYNGIDVFRGNTKSCGCARRNKLIERNKHNNPSKKRTNWYSKYPYDTCIGTTVNGLKFVKEIERSKYDRRRFIILCQCGIKFECDGIHIFNGSVKSCGCYKSKIISETSSTHRMTGTSEYGIWAAMMQRCNNPKHKSYHLYGGRGIEVCDEWKDFDCFIKDMGKRPSTKYTIDRIDTNGNYEPGNCRWSTRIVQSRNQRLRADNSTGVKGVSMSGESYLVRISVNNKRITIGSFNTLAKAKRAREQAELKYWK